MHNCNFINNYFMLHDRSTNSSQPIWGTHMFSSSTDTCYGTRNTCPLIPITSCKNSNVVTVECSKLYYIFLVFTHLSYCVRH